MEQFEAYFRKADLDQDGKISGAEAVSFLQGSNLPKQILAQIWMHADQSHTGYLSRPEFYNALKLVTVAQSKRDLTPDMVKAALYGPASTKIPAPQINLAVTSRPQINSASAAPAPQLGAVSTASSQNPGFRGQSPLNAGMNQQFVQAPMNTGLNQHFGQAPSSAGMNQHFGQASSSAGMNQQFGQAPSSAGMNQQFFPSQDNQSIKPSLPTSTSSSHPPQADGSQNIPWGGSLMGPGLQNPNVTNDWVVGRTGAASTGPTPQVLNKASSPSTPSIAPKPQDPVSMNFSTAAKNSKALVSSVDGFSSDPMFVGDAFSVIQSSSNQALSAPIHPASSVPTSSAIVPVSTAPQTSSKPNPFEALRSTLTRASAGGQSQQTPSLPKSNQQLSIPAVSSVLPSGMPVSVGKSASEQSQISWPKMTRASVQKYSKVFMEVDTDRDGKITGEQSRNLFLSWRLPREVLKQVWDLSDQDSDSMLSLREFSIALYLMERYREGSTLPSKLPNSVMLDETLLSLTGPPITSHGIMGWGPTAGVRQQQGLPGTQPNAPAGMRPPAQSMFPRADRLMQFNQQNGRGASVDNSHTNQLITGEGNSLDAKGLEAADTDEKVEKEEKVLLDSKEKLEFYRTKMQDLVLYKSRCDNRLNEITERASADKREAELLAKKYEEKYKQVAEIASKLTIEEASFREIQERKMELHQAIIKMEQGGSADGILQVRADRIQSDLEELLKVLAERCKKHELLIKSNALIELPLGWQPGIPEVAAIWDEEWDKFEDEGFSFDVIVPANAKHKAVERENSSPAHSFSPDLVSNTDAMYEKPFSKEVGAFETESAGTHSEDDESKSLRESPMSQTVYESPSQEHSENHFTKTSDGDAETHSFDGPAWGAFDNNNDTDSVWGFGAKDSDREKHGEKYFFGSNDFDASPARTDSPLADNAFQRSSLFAFEDSVPGSPLSRAGNSPPGHDVGSKDPFFDSFSRYDSFSTRDGSPPHRETFTRFDSISSTRDFDHSRGFSFDDSDPFGSSGPFKVSSSKSNSDKKF